MPQFVYRGRDQNGALRSGERFAQDIEVLNNQLFNEGITPIEISPYIEKQPALSKFYSWLQGDSVKLEELAIFARQMELLHQAGVPLITSLMQLSDYMRSPSVVYALKGVIAAIEKGQSLATALQQFPDVFSPLMVNIIRIGESTGHLTEAFSHLHKYLTFEASSIKQLKSAFRYPIFVVGAIFFAVIVLNLFVIPSFARFYSGASINLPWQTKLLISTSNFFLHYSYYLLFLSIAIAYVIYRYLKTKQGKYNFHHWLLRLPVVGKLLRRIILIRFSQTLAIVINAGVSITVGLGLVRDVLQNAYVNAQLIETQEMIERGNSFTQAIKKVDLFSPIELQILSVGENNGEIGNALSYIGEFHGNEIEYDLKRMNDIIGPVLITGVSILILIIALGVYLPIWNMVSSARG